jgi:NADH-ubiquinone oxidoreductase chain 6
MTIHQAMVFVGGILVLFIYITRLASNEIFSLSIKIIIITAIFIPRIIIIEN